MDDSAFDRLVRTLEGSRTRRSAGAVLGALAALPWIGHEDAGAKKKKPKNSGTTRPPVCTPRCNGCGGSDGYGGGVLNGGIPPSEVGGTITFDSSSRMVESTAVTSDGAIYNRRGITNLNGATVSGNSTPECTDVSGC